MKHKKPTREQLMIELTEAQQLISELVISASEHKRVLEALKNSENQYRSTVDDMADPLHVVDRDMRILLLNKAFKKWIRELGLEEETEGKKVFEVFPFLPNKVQYEYDTVFETGDLLITEEEIAVRERNFFTETRKIPIFENGKVTRVITIIRDITERRRAEEERKKLEVQLVQAQKMEAMGTLAGGIAHDFNNILSAVIAYAERGIHAVAEPGKVRKNLDEILQVSSRARDLVKQILAFSRQTKHEYIRIKLDATIKESLNMLRAILPATIEIRQNLLAEGRVLADSTQIHQVMMNLCSNAAQAMGDSGGVLEVSLNKVTIEEGAEAHALDLPPGPYVKLTVSDTGHGMTPEVIERIFDPYFTTKEKGQGTGLGLSVVHGIVKSHRGAITCKSVPGKGTTFDIYIPETESKKEAAHP